MLQGRMRKLLNGLAPGLTDDEIDFLNELIDANEPGVALEELAATLLEQGAPLEQAVIREIRDLVETMGLDADVVDQLERLSHG
jgi:hypothetical protein